MKDEGRRHHDTGGLPAGKVVRDEHEREAWEKRCDALAVLLWDGKRKLVKVDERRRHIEDLGAEVYRGMGYYERWMHSVTQALLEHGVITVDELGRMMERKRDG